MLYDSHGLPIDGSAECVAAYDRAIAHLWRLRPEVIDETEVALARDPDCVMAVALRAYLGLTSTEWSSARRAARAVGDRRGATDRERGHLAAIRAWARGDWRAAARMLDDVLEAYPMDALALIVGHQLDFFLGDAANLRGRVERALRAWDPRHPDLGFAKGQLAFGLEESGDYAAAEAAGRAALAANRDDVWAIHALAHVFEMRGEAGRGADFLKDVREDWSDGNMLAVHVAWHEAIFRLEHEDRAAVLGIYDARIRPPGADANPLALLDATALLWRLRLDGYDVGERWAPLADDWARQEERPWYVFNDLHAVMAMIGAGRMDDAAAIVARLATYARDGAPEETNQAMTAAAGLAVARGLLAFGRGDPAGAVHALAPVSGHLAIFGGSHAQRDAFQRTLLVAAQRAGEVAYARRLASARLAERPASVWARRRMEEIEA
jgi:tetratricopeptide (TPR) repeat protein